jgi:quinoprotein glucose dehydrogenase
MKYSPLQQINRTNVTTLRVAWVFHTGETAHGEVSASRRSFEATPIVIDGTMYVVTPFHRLIALDAETGRELWRFDPILDGEGAFTHFMNRGVAYWSDKKAARIFYVTGDGRLFAIEAHFGEGGRFVRNRRLGRPPRGRR